MPFSWFKKPVIHQNTGNHIMFMHTKCGLRYEDFYLADIISSLIQMSRVVTICTTDVHRYSPLNQIEDSTNSLKFIRSWGRPATTSLLALNAFIKEARMMCLVFQVMLRPPSPAPSLIITDTNTFAISLLKTFTSYRVIHIQHFSRIYKGDSFQPIMNVNFKSSTERSLRRADEIIVQTECLKQVMERSLIEFKSKITVLYPCCDIGFWSHPLRNMDNLVPLLPENLILFAVFGEYKPRSNFELILNAFRYFTYCSTTEVVLRTRVVFAGFYDELSDSEMIYYKKLVAQVQESPYTSNIIFFKRTNIPQQKTVINNCTAILNPTNHNVYPGAILMAMNFKIPIVSVNNGFAATVLENNVSGFLIDKTVSNMPATFARKMSELVENPQVAELVVECAKSEFDEKYNCFIHRRRINSMVTRQIYRHY